MERKSHAQTVHDQVTADSLSLVVNVLQCVHRQLLTPPPMSSKLVSKFAIPSANSKYPDHRRLNQINRLVLCEIRLMAISSTQGSGVSICPRNNFEPRHISAMRPDNWSGGHLASDFTYWSHNLAQQRPPTLCSMREIQQHSR